MPVIDVRDHGLLRTVFLPGMRLQLEEAGRPAGSTICYFNIYFGVTHLIYKGGAWYICKLLKFDYALVAFYNIPRKLVWKRPGKVRDDAGLCATLLWVAEEPRAEHIHEVLRFADSIIDNIELLKGRPCPLPMRALQLPSSFEVAILRSEDKKGKAREEIVVGELHDTDRLNIVLSDDDVYRVSALEGVFGPIDYDALPAADRAVRLSALWQRKAIEASGLEDWSAVVLYSNTWIETFIVQLAVILNDAKNNPIEDVRSALQPGLHKFAVTYLGSKYLNGRWDYTQSSTAFGGWYELCYMKRHEIVHIGHFATREEAIKAYDAAHRFAFWMTGLAGKVQDKDLREAMGTLLTMAQHPRAAKA